VCYREPKVLRVALSFPTLDFTKSQVIATLAAMTSNFFLNNLFTYRDQRLSGLRNGQQEPRHSGP